MQSQGSYWKKAISPPRFPSCHLGNFLSLRKHFLFTILFTIACFLNACSKPPAPPRPITGEAFVVLKNRETIKLSLLKIHLVGNTEGAIARSNAISIDDEWRMKLPFVESYKSNLAEFSELIETQKETIQSTIESRDWSIATARDEQISMSSRMKAGELWRECKAELETLNKHLDDLISNKRDVQKQIDDLLLELGSCDAYCFLASYSWTNTLATITSDSDGKFVIMPPKEPSYIFAVAERKTGNREEHYAWIVPLITNRPVSLNNDNMIPIYSP